MMCVCVCVTKFLIRYWIGSGEIGGGGADLGSLAYITAVSFCLFAEAFGEGA